MQVNPESIQYPDSNTPPSCLVDVFGSCVSRSIFHNGNPTAKGCADPRIKINRYFFRHSILSCMVPPPNTALLNPTIANCLTNDTIKTQDNFFKALKEELLKTVLPMIRESNGEYFVFDLFDLFTLHLLYDNTILTNIDCVMFRVDAYRNQPESFSTFFPFDLPLGLWYGYIKLFMDEIINKYGAEHVVLVRLTACGSYLSKNKTVLPFSKQASDFYTATPKYNKQARELEDRLLREYNINSIDYSKYYIDDEEYWSNLQGAHFSKGYYTESFKKMKEILLRDSSLDTHNCLRFSELSFEGISDILKIPASDKEYAVMWNQIVSPLRNLNHIPAFQRLATYSDEKIIQHRLFLSNIFAVAESIDYILNNTAFNNAEKNFFMLQELENQLQKPYDSMQLLILKDLFPDSDNRSLSAIFQSSDCSQYEFSFEAVFYKFLLLFDHSNLGWISYLQQAEQLNPNHVETLRYLLYYANAIEDTELINHYTNRLEELENKAK